MWLRLIGPPCLFSATGQPKRLATKKQIALLVYLHNAMGVRRVRRDTIVELLWPDLSFEKGRQSLSQGLSEIRNRLGPDVVTRGGTHISLLKVLKTDITNLDNLELELDGDPTPLEDLENVSGVDFAHWVEATRVTLKKDLRKQLNADIDRLRAQGDRTVVRERARQLYEIDPLNVRAASILAEAAAQRGDPETAEKLIDSVLEHTGDNNADFAALTELRVRLKSSMRTRDGTKFTKRWFTLIGRNEELRQLHTIAASQDKTAHTAVLITGRPGSGKSALADRFVTDLQADGQLCIRIVCQSGDHHHLIAKHVAQALTPYPELGSTDPKSLSELCSVAPFLRTSYPGIPIDSQGGNEFSTVAGAAALANAMDAVANGKPVTLCLDHIDRVDRLSVALLGELLHNTLPFPLTIVATTSCDHGVISMDERKLIDGIPWTDVLPLKPLQSESGRQLVRTIELMKNIKLSGTDVERIVSWTQGSPLLIELVLSDIQTNRNQSLCSLSVHRDLVKSWRPPPRICAQLEQRFKSFWVAARATADFLAVSTQPVSLAALRSVTSCEKKALRQACDIGIEIGVLVVAPNGFTFANTIFREYAASRVSEQRRRHCHRMLAGDIVKRCKPGSPESAEAIQHFRLAQDSKDAARLTRAVVRQCVEGGNFKIAETLLRRSLQSPAESQETTRLLLARVVTVRGRYDEAIRLLRRINTSKLNVEEIREHKFLFAEASNGLRPARGRQRNTATTDLLNYSDGVRYGLQNDLALLLAGEAAAHDRNWSDLRRISITAQRKSLTKTANSCHLSLAFCQMTQGLYDQAIGNFQRSAVLLGHDKKTIELARAFNGIGMCAFALGHLSSAVAAFKSAHTLAQDLGNTNFAGAIASNLAATYTDYDFPRKAGEWLQQSTKTLRQQNKRSKYRFSVLANVADQAILRGESDRGIDTVEEALSNAGDDVITSAHLRCARVDLLLAQDAWEPAVREVGQMEKAFGFTTSKKTQRFVPGFDSPHLARLLFLKAWYSGAKETTRRMSITWPTAAMSVAQHVELLAVFGWCAEQDDPRDRAKTAERAHRQTAELVQLHGLTGVLRRLKCLGVLGHKLQPLVS